jgi:1,5-anhydro-D-fructose reductase (1,5-anhydro-D-mannitol-forming)
LKAEIENGTIGRPLAIRVTFSVLLPESVWTWRLDASRWGGVSFDLGTHAADLVRWLAGSEVRRVGCITARQLLPGTAEDAAVATLELENGCLAQLYLSFNTPPGVLDVEVHGSRAKLVSASRLARLTEGTVTLSDDRGDRVLEAPPVGLYEQHVRAINLATRGDGLPLANGEDGFRSLEVGLAMLEASRDGGTVDLAASSR